MNLADVMEQLATRVNVIPGLRGFAWPVENPPVPAALMLLPDPDALRFDMTYGRGMDRLTLPLAVVVSRASLRTGVKQLAAYCDGSGPSSIKAVLESGSYTAFDTVIVMSAGSNPVRIGDVDYLGAQFTLDIGGSGTS